MGPLQARAVEQPVRIPDQTGRSNAWQSAAACRGEDSRLFFHPEGERGLSRKFREHEAKQICSACPVRVDCLRHALTVGEDYGIWGGLAAVERQALLANSTFEV